MSDIEVFFDNVKSFLFLVTFGIFFITFFVIALVLKFVKGVYIRISKIVKKRLKC